MGRLSVDARIRLLRELLERRPLVLHLHSARRGSLVVTEYPPVGGGVAERPGGVCHVELTRVQAGVVPDDPVWHGDES